jgi:hypothetical protein
MLDNTNTQSFTMSKKCHFQICLSINKCLLDILISLVVVFAVIAHVAEAQFYMRNQE